MDIRTGQHGGGVFNYIIFCIANNLHFHWSNSYFKQLKTKFTQLVSHKNVKLTSTYIKLYFSNKPIFQGDPLYIFWCEEQNPLSYTQKPMQNAKIYIIKEKLVNFFREEFVLDS